MTGLLTLKGVGPKKAKALEDSGIYTLRELLYYSPYRYEDRTVFHQFDEIKVGEMANLIGKVVEINLHEYERTKLEVLVAMDGGVIQVVYFTAISFWKHRFKVGQKLRLWGKIQFYNQYQMTHPNLDFLKSNEEPVLDVLPRYHLKQTMSQSKIEHRFLQKTIIQVLTQFSFEDPLSVKIRKKLKILDEVQMLRNLHNPKTILQARQAQDELFIRHWYPVCLELEKNKQNRSKIGRSFPPSIHYKRKVLSNLSFELTVDQKNALEQIEKGLSKSIQYYGLLNGDVGCGKTIVALLSALSVIEKKQQVVVMAPTEILALQHFDSFKRFLKSTDIQCSLLIGNLTPLEKEKEKQEILKGNSQLIVGTQAVFSKNIEYHNLGYIILDEQQRYGVNQRKMLMEKGKHPDVLQMSATPIPQSLVQVFYGDMEQIVIRQKPQESKKNYTRLVSFEKRQDLLQFLWEKSQKQEPFFWVLPRIEDVMSWDDLEPLPTIEKIYQEFLMFKPQWNIAPFHGKIKTKEQQIILQKLKNNKIQGLIATTVIEVGIDLPFVNLMVIDAPEYFGLSQLHQLRGRIGRGNQDSWCFLLLSKKQTLGQRRRLKEFSNLHKGFQIAELDLELRGPGELEGKHQSGYRDFTSINVKKQLEILRGLRKKIRNK